MSAQANRAASSSSSSVPDHKEKKDKEKADKDKEKKSKKKSPASSTYTKESSYDPDSLERSGHTSDTSSGDERDPQRDRIPRAASTSPPAAQPSDIIRPMPVSVMLLQIALPAEVRLFV